MPTSKSSTSFDLAFQAVSVGAQLCVRKIFAANLEDVQQELVRDIAAALGGFLGLGLHGELPSLRVGICATKLVIVGVVGRVVSVAAIDDSFKAPFAVVDGRDWFRRVCILDR